jgi:hypothetical protein
MNHEEMISQLRQWVMDTHKESTTIIKGLWHLECIYKPDPHERKFVYQILVAQTTAQGSCYYPGSPISKETLISLVGEQYDFTPSPNLALDIALLDSVANAFPQQAHIESWLSGSSSKKARERARIITSEVNRLACTKSHSRRLRICNVGVVSILIRELLHEGFDISATDMDTSIIGNKLFDSVLVNPSTETLKQVSESDIAVVTGMTLATETLADIIDTAAKTGTLVVIFAETGSGFSPFFIQRGVACVVSEPFPFYIFDGITCIRVFRASFL